jgi:ParB family chromosome partitioning protein
MALDLSMLDDAPFGTVPANQIGAVLALRLDEVEEDPDQPRQVFDVEQLESLAAAIRQRGVQSPIIVRPKAGGVYRIVHGARRYRASKLAGLATIPAIVQADVRRFDDYSQILENLQRADLKPMEIAQFIRKRQSAGDSNKVIAQRLCMIPASVTWHLALLDAAEPILTAFHAGRLTGAEQVYHLQKLYEQRPEAVDTFLASSSDITQRMIRDLGSAISGKTTGGEGEMHLINKTGRSLQSPAVVQRDDGQSSTSDSASQKEGEAPAGAGKAVRSDPARFRHPVLRAMYDTQPVVLQLFRRPTSPGWAFVIYEGDGDEEEVELALLSDWTLSEGA